MTSETKPKRWTVQMLKEAVDAHLHSHHFRLLSIEARQQVVEHLLVEVLESAEEPDAKEPDKDALH